jgi:hypothetical protein
MAVKVGGSQRMIGAAKTAFIARKPHFVAGPTAGFKRQYPFTARGDIGVVKAPGVLTAKAFPLLQKQ